MKEKKVLKKLITKVKIVFLMLFVIACDKGLNENFQGLWKIEEIKYSNEDYLRNLHINTIFFSDNEVTTPSTKDYPNVDSGQWEIISFNKNIDSLIIESKNKVFNGKYSIKFAVDSTDNSIYAQLISKDVFMLIHKANLDIWYHGQSDK